MQKVKIAICVIASLFSTACSVNSSKPKSKERKYYMGAVRQLAPDPVYSRLRWVQLPEPLPSKELAPPSPFRILPVYSFDVKDAKIEDVAKLLGDTSRYSSYAASNIKEKKISIQTLGTVDEIAEAIGRKAQIDVTVDHETKEVRFLQHGVKPGFFSEKVTDNEHKSSH